MNGDKAFFGLFGIVFVATIAWWVFVAVMIVLVLSHFGIL
jgi:hypothetical protein